MTKRKKHKPREILNPLAAFQTLPKDVIDKNVAKNLSSIEAIARCAHPGPDEWRDLSDVVNVLEQLVIQKQIDADHMVAINEATTAMVAAATRYKAGKGMRMTGPELESMRYVCAIYEAAMQRLSWLVIHRAAQAADRYVASVRSQRSTTTTTISI